MKRRVLFGIIFILSSISLIISLSLFWNLGIYVDEYNTSLNIVYGSEFWLYMAWLRLLVLGIIALVSGIGIFVKGK